jgi:predicted esterase
VKPLAGACLVTLLCPAFAAAQDGSALDRAFAAFWRAEGGKETSRAIEAVRGSGASFDAVLEKLTGGRLYDPKAATGELRWPTLPGGGVSHATTIVVPRAYNAAVKYPVRVYLHGGVARPDPEDSSEDPAGATPNRNGRPRRRLEFKERYIAVYPSGYADAMWWFSSQMTNLDVILDHLKRTYNVDENRIHLMGVSDGGTGTFFVGLKNPTPWSVFFPLNGFLRVLSNPEVGAEGELFTTNLTNRPIFAVNGELDPLYPVVAVLPTLLMLERAGARVIFRPEAGAGHNTAWWPTAVNSIDKFEEEHPRDPFPASLSWETERTDRYNRVAWLVVDRLDATKSGETFPDNNTYDIQEPADFGLRVDSRRGDGRKIIEVVEGTTAAAMGLKKGDTVMRMDDTTIHTAGDMGRAFDEHEAGTPMVFEVDRKGQRLTMRGSFPPTPKPPRKQEMFKHSKPSGRVTIVHEGNSFEARTRGVAEFTLLLSPQMIDFAKPVRVTVDGKAAFEGMVEKSVATLLKYAARDNDRAMLFGAELPIVVP